MEPRGRERHGRAAHLGERAGANESNVLQIFHFHGAGAPQVAVPNFSGLTACQPRIYGGRLSPHALMRRLEESVVIAESDIKLLREILERI